MTVGQALAQGAKLLDDAGVPVPRLTAEVLLAHAIRCERIWLVAHSTDELREVWWIHYGRYLHQRLLGHPTQHITGRQEFYGREFRVTREVLIPRPETEHVIEAALQLAPGSRRILDLGTGSGAIAVTLALELPEARVMATDLSEAAVRVALLNANALGARVNFAVCDLGSAWADAAFDSVVSNPPYVAARDKATLQREVREHEPGLALYGGEDGLDVYRRLIPEAARLLAPEGWLILEIGCAQHRPVGAMLGAGLQSPWTSVEMRADLAGLPRVLCARKR